MPPYVPRKRTHDVSPAEGEELPRKKGKSAAVNAPPRKATLFDDLDSTATPNSRLSATKQIDDSNDDESPLSSLSGLSDADFEDVPTPASKRQSVGQAPDDRDEDDDEDDDIEFEDVQTRFTAVPVGQGHQPSGDLQLTLVKDTRVPLTNPLGTKKGPTKRERAIRIAAHSLHTQLLLWHNAIRNAWLCDAEVQGILVSYLPERLWEEVERWRRNSGLEGQEAAPKKNSKPSPKGKSKGEGKAREISKAKHAVEKNDRDWGAAAVRLEKGKVDMSHGDPLFRLMKALSAWWKQRFRVTAPGLRKGGYMSLERLDRLTKAHKESEEDPERFGERISSLDEFRDRARSCSGSRDVGAQLFTALLRGLGLETRLVGSIQPLGFGWNRLEEAEPETEGSKIYGPTSGKVDGSEERSKSGANSRVKNAKSAKAGKSNAAVSDDGEEFELLAEDSDDDSVIEIPQATPKKKTYDKDLEFPHYWTEVLSPVTNKYLPVDALVKSVVATNRELVESFEPRGSKADKARQVMAYIVGYSQDGTAKDVTVRYLKRQMLPGRTKGMRMPVEKVPIYNKNGKVKKYEYFDWFKSVMRGYARGSRTRPFTEADDEEDSTDLKPAKMEKKEVKEGEETLQHYKQSQEFILPRHLKREEALAPSAKPVKVFKSKGKGSEVMEEDVYLRKDVVQVKSAETWHKQGRAPIDGEEPLKKAPYRAATTNRRREIAEAEAASGEKVLQGLYSFDQTDWIIPPAIENGIIPKNQYGNIDLFVEHMCPAGAVHVPYRGAIRVCKRLGIDYAEAVVDFEFGHRMAVPVIQGVVIAEEHHDQVMEELAKDEAERSRKEDEKRRKAALGMWRKLLMGMRIVQRIRHEYGDIKDDMPIFGHSNGPEQDVLEEPTGDEDMAGGFLPEGYVEEGEGEPRHTSSFFPVVDHDDEDDGEDTLLVDHGDHTRPREAQAYPTPQSGESSRAKTEPREEVESKPTARPKPKSTKNTVKVKAATRASSRRKSSRKAARTSEEEEDEEDGDYDMMDSDADYRD